MLRLKLRISSGQRLSNPFARRLDTRPSSSRSVARNTWHESRCHGSGPNLLNMVAPLTWHVSLELLITLGELTILTNDPSAGAPLAIERARYASEQTELLRVEHSLWRLASEFGGPSDRIPYFYRVILLRLAWDPVAHEADTGAWTLCVRCAELLHRKRSFKTLPRCPDCMKETGRQRRWPQHAVAPHRRGAWLLRCQYHDCETVYEGPRHRKYCEIHTSSRLAPGRRASRTKTTEPSAEQD